MKWMLLSIILLSSITISFAQSSNQLSFKKLDGESVSLSSFSGKKVLFVLVPFSESDSNFTQLRDFQSKYKDSIQIVGILSIEDGYQSSNQSAVQSLYSNSGIILTEGMHTRKAAGENQSALMKWLTDKNKNQHFDMDVKGTGQKFFVTGRGRLFAVMPPQVSFTSPIIDKIIHSPTQ